MKTADRKPLPLSLQGTDLLRRFLCLAIRLALAVLAPGYLITYPPGLERAVVLQGQVAGSLNG